MLSYLVKKLLLFLLLCWPLASWQQAIPPALSYDSSQQINSRYNSTLKNYKLVNPFSFITNVPGNIARIASVPFNKKSLIPLTVVAGTTGVLLLLDQPIIDGVHKVFTNLGIQQQEHFKEVELADVDICTYPGNINSFFYQLGRTTPTLLVAGGFYICGRLTGDVRAFRTASEITSSFLSTMITIQTLKRITGRQSPNRATAPGGHWSWFPSLRDYNRNTTNYIAFPSGHMGNMMSLVTVVSENYPEKKWIKPVGYSIIGLTALSQLNNKTHWPSDFILGLAIGYVSGKISHLRNEPKPESRLMQY